MNCPHCNSWSTVLETRGDARRRECGNGHRFSTREVVAQQPQLLADRNRQIAAALRAGKSQSEIARSFGLKSHSEVSRLAKKLGLSQNARSLGQYRRWETSKHRSV